MSPHEEAAFRASMGAAGGVLERLEAMRRDKALLRASMLRDPPVPSGLASRVEETLGREALVSSGVGGAGASPELFEARSPSGRAWSSGGWTVGVSMAAGIAIAVIGGFLVLTRPISPTAPQRTIARADAPPSEPAASIALPRTEQTVHGSESAGPGKTRLLPGALARHEVMVMAEQHRLALRVSAEEPGALIAAIEAAAEGPSWRVLREASAEVADAIGVRVAAEVPRDLPDAAPIDPSWLLRPTQDAMAVYLAEVDLSEAGLEALSSGVLRLGRSRAGYAALEDSLHEVLSEAALAEARPTVWWLRHNRPQVRRTIVPVVIERP